MARLSQQQVHHAQRTKSGSKLNEGLVARIKWILIKGVESKRDIAQAYGVSLWTIRAIDRGDVWGWVQPDFGPEGAEPVAQTSDITDEAVKASMEKLSRLLEKETAPQRLVEEFISPRAAGYLGKGQGPEETHGGQQRDNNTTQTTELDSDTPGNGSPNRSEDGGEAGGSTASGAGGGPTADHEADG